MIPPMMSESPPPSDDDISMDDSEELKTHDSSYDITGLSQKLQAPTHEDRSFKSEVSDDQSVVTELPPAATTTELRAADSGATETSLDEWGDFSAATLGSTSEVVSFSDVCFSVPRSKNFLKDVSYSNFGKAQEMLQPNAASSSVCGKEEQIECTITREKRQARSSATDRSEPPNHDDVLDDQALDANSDPDALITGDFVASNSRNTVNMDTNTSVASRISVGDLNVNGSVEDLNFETDKIDQSSTKIEEKYTSQESVTETLYSIGATIIINPDDAGTNRDCLLLSSVKECDLIFSDESNHAKPPGKAIDLSDGLLSSGKDQFEDLELSVEEVGIIDVMQLDEKVDTVSVPFDEDFSEFAVSAACENPAFPDNGDDELSNLSTSVDDFGGLAEPTYDLKAFSKATDYCDAFAEPVEEFGEFAEPVDDFGDFPAAASAGFADFGSAFGSELCGQPVGFAGHESLKFDSTSIDDEFGEFEENHSVPQLDLSSGMEAVSAVLSALFPPVSEEREPSTAPLDTGCVWCQLRDQEATAALRYRWSGSRANSHLLHALKVDANNVISFGLSAGGGWVGARDRDPEPLQSKPVSADFSCTASATQATPEPAEVPAAAFDWEGSGLKNPLEAGGLERELLRDDSAVTPTPSQPAGALYNRLMQQQTTVAPLSEAAAHVVARIPNIDFMQARVLMFPVSGE